MALVWVLRHPDWMAGRIAVTVILPIRLAEFRNRFGRGLLGKPTTSHGFLTHARFPLTGDTPRLAHHEPVIIPP